jgi:hypothetical protein
MGHRIAGSTWEAIYHGILRWATKQHAVVNLTNKRQITIETHSMTIIRQRRNLRAWCHECAREVDMIDIEEARALAGVTPQALRHSAGTQGWHLLESGDGLLLVCLESLLKSL